jgi:hypothetical protein
MPARVKEAEEVWRKNRLEIILSSHEFAATCQ